MFGRALEKGGVSPLTSGSVNTVCLDQTRTFAQVETLVCGWEKLPQESRKVGSSMEPNFERFHNGVEIAGLRKRGISLT